MKLSFALILAFSLTICCALEDADDHDLFELEGARVQRAPRNSIKVRGVDIIKSLPPSQFCAHPVLYAFYVRSVFGEKDSTIAMYAENPVDFGFQRCSGAELSSTGAWARDEGYGLRIAAYVVLGLDKNLYSGPDPEAIVKREMNKVRDVFQASFEHLQFTGPQLRIILDNTNVTDQFFGVKAIKDLEKGIPEFGDNFAGYNAITLFSNVPGHQYHEYCSRDKYLYCLKTWELKVMELYGNSDRNKWKGYVGVVST